MISLPETSFKYAPLPPQTTDQLIIRILLLLPDKSSSAIVRCELREVSLDEEPIYEAVSYCWGDKAFTRPIICNGSQLRVTINLEAALRNLRYPETKRVLWADAVCINQVDLAERSGQVQIMRNIFGGAKGALVWLGGQTRSSQVALRLVDEFLEASLKTLGDSVQLTLKRLFANGLSVRHMKDGIGHLQELLRRPWFHRLWIVQEVAVAKEVTIICGSDEMSWERLIAMLMLFDGMGILTTHNSLDFEKLGLPLLINDARLHHRRISHKDISTRSQLPISFTSAESSEVRPTKPSSWSISSKTVFIGVPNNAEMLTFPLWFRRLLATDPRDKLFALHGLKEKATNIRTLTADYTMSITDTYHDFAINMLQATQSLDILSAAHRDYNISKRLPSWVPDWSESRSSDVALVGQISSRFRATRESRYSSKFLDQRLILVIESQIIDKISDVGSALNYVPMMSDRASTNLSHLNRHLEATANYQKILASWERITQQKIYITGEDQRSVYRTTLIAGHERSGAATAGYDGWQRANWPMRLLAPWKLENRPVPIKMAAALHYLTSTIQATTVKRGERINNRYAINGGPNFTQRRSFERYLTMAFGRRLARTEKGYLALVPAHAGVGDSIALCKGGKTPLVLKPSVAGSWELVGDAYVHGIMNGEAFDEDKCEEIHIV